MDTQEPPRPDLSPADLARLVRQHARTSQLLGVDFVPAYRNGRSGLIEAPQEASPMAAPPSASRTFDPPRAAAPPVAVAATREPSAAPPAQVANPAVKAPASRAEAKAPLTPLPPKDRANNERELALLRARYEAEAPHARFDTTFTNIVWSDGDAAARICFVGEAPGEDEDIQGKPFVGRSGQLLDKMIVAMGLSRSEVYICNVLKTRPPGNRTPTLDEVEACRPYLLEQLSIVRPEAVVGLGLSACGALLGGGEPMSRLRGRWWEIEDARGVRIPFMPTYHPAFLLRSYSDENRTKVWSDLKMVMERLGLVGKKTPA